jgi:cytochrome c oxidase assembly factor CtaG
MLPLTFASAVTVWRFAVLPSAALAMLAASYLAGVAAVARRRRARGRRARAWPPARTLAFLGGLGVVAVATQGSPAAYDDALLTAHMAQHLLLIMVAPVLLVAGRPVTLALRASRGRWRPRAAPIVRSRALTALTWPPAAVALYTAVVAVTHLTGLIAARGVVHDGEHVAYLASGYLLFLSVLSVEPTRWRLAPFGGYLVLLAAMPADIGTGAVLMLRPALAGYPAADVHAAGLVMVAGGEAIMAVLALGLAVKVTRGQGRRRPGEDPAELARYNAWLASLHADPGVGDGPSVGGGRLVLDVLVPDHGVVHDADDLARGHREHEDPGAQPK